MKKVEVQLTQTFEEQPIDALQTFIGKKIEKIYTFGIALNVDSLAKSNGEHAKLFFKTSDECIYEMSSEGYTEDYYFDMKKNVIKLVEQIEVGFMEFEFSNDYLVRKIFVFSLKQEFVFEDWQIKNIYNEKWHSEKRGIKFNEEFYPDVYETTTLEDSYIVFSNEKDEYLSVGTQLMPYYSITNNKADINKLLFVGETWKKQSIENPYRLTRVIE